jgi:hypothetical protein
VGILSCRLYWLGVTHGGVDDHQFEDGEDGDEEEDVCGGLA